MQVHACAFVVVCVYVPLCACIFYMRVSREPRATHACYSQQRQHVVLNGIHSLPSTMQLAVSFDGEIIRVCSTSESGLQQLATHAF